MNKLSERYHGSPTHAAGSRTVCVARHVVTGLTCVLKYAAVGTPEERGILDEATLLRELEHPSLVQLVDRFSDLVDFDGRRSVSGIATRWVDGEPLDRLGPRAPRNQNVAWFAALVDVVGYLHRQRVLHLDLKPANVLASSAGVVLLDLGTARRIDAPRAASGGTLGFAAPEVIAGEPPTVASDLYSLGAIFYELLSGRRPFGDLPPARLRQTVLHDQPFPVRALTPDIPRELASLADELLARDPASRPSSTAEVLERLLEAGIAAPPGHPGSPAFTGRERERSALAELLHQEKAPFVALSGAPGSGRTRLARHVLHDLADRHDYDFVDLSMAEQPIASLKRIPQRSDPGPRRPVLYFLGRVDDVPFDEVATLRERVAALAPPVAVVCAAPHAIPGARSLPLAPMSTAELESIGRALGVVSPRELGEHVAAAAGSPGPLLRRIGLGGMGLDALPPVAAEALAALGTLPAGIPRSIVARLPRTLREGLSVLASRGIAHIGAGGNTFLDPRKNDAIPPELAAIVAEVIDSNTAVDPLWAATTLARMGRLAPAQKLLERHGATRSASRRSMMLELTGRLSAAGDRDAGLVEARLWLAEGVPERAISVLERNAERSLDEEALYLRALRHAGRIDEAESRANAGIARTDAAAYWLELAHVRLRRVDLPSAADACRAAIDRDPDLISGEGFEVQAKIAAEQLAAGHDVDIGHLRAELDRRPVDDLSRTAVEAVGLALMWKGELDRASELFGVAADRAQQEGDLVRAMSIRVNRGTCLFRLGRGREVRQEYIAALMIARAIGAQRQVLKLCYSLAELELRHGQLAAAERYLADLRELVPQSGVPGAAERVALLEAWALLGQSRAAAARDVLQPMHPDDLPPGVAAARAILLGRALLAVGDPAEALHVTESAPPTTDAAGARQLALVRGRAYIALGRQQLAVARDALPEEPDPLEREDVGAILFYAAGEELDASTFPARRHDLERATRLLTGPLATQAATLRDRLLASPGAGLESIVRLTEAMHDLRSFPGALARLVAEALGAHRVLITLRIPGLGRQIECKELTGAEAAGISREVLGRIRSPGDVWIADDAFADPAIREVSATVRTFEIKSLIAVAIPRGTEAIGALYVDDLNRRKRFADDDVALLKRLGEAVGQLVDLVPAARAGRLVEARDVLGILLTDLDEIHALEDTLARLKRERQSNLLLTGPTGAGKTWFAKRLAREVLGLTGIEEVVMTKRDPTMLASTLWGTERGDFTGAIEKAGAVERAIRGNRALFLDEVQALDDAGQQVVLPLLELPHRRLSSVTGSAASTDRVLHVILGTNVEVANGHWEKHFRTDLWYRMSRVHIHLPPLAARGREVVYSYLRRMLEHHGAPEPEVVLDIRALHRVTGHTWKGNLRELDAFAANLAHVWHEEQRPLELADLKRCQFDDELGSSEVDVPADTNLDTIELEAVLASLRRHDWSQASAARELGISKWTLRRVLRRHGLVEQVREQRERQRATDSPD